MKSVSARMASGIEVLVKDAFNCPKASSNISRGVAGADVGQTALLALETHETQGNEALPPRFSEQDGIGQGEDFGDLDMGCDKRSQRHMGLRHDQGWTEAVSRDVSHYKPH